MNAERKLTVAQAEAELKRIYRERKRANKSYTYREYARDLQLNFTTIFKVLNGQRRLGLHMAKAFGEQAGFKIETLSSRLREKRQEKYALKTLNPLSEIQVHWLSLAILECLNLKDFKANPVWIAEKFNLPLETVEILLRRMELDGLLERKDGVWKDTAENSAALGDGATTGQIVRRILKELMTVSAATIDTVPFDQREHSFAIFPVSKSEVPRLKKKLITFQREFGHATASSKKSKDDVYSLQIGFFPLTGRTQ